MPAIEFDCKVIEKSWLTPTVVGLKFEPSRSVRFEAGQFLSVIVPEGYSPPQNPKILSLEQAGFVSDLNRFPLAQRVRRLYSFAGSPDRGAPLELCVKLVAGGAGSTYLASLEVGDHFRASAPFGDFYFRPPESGQKICFLSTGTGIAPFRAMVLSKLWREQGPEQAVSINGCRTLDEVCYPGFFASQGVQEIVAVSDAPAEWTGFRGRVTDCLKALPLNWGWQTTDFYLCGNPRMVDEVIELLVSARAVPPRNIFHEAYFGASDWKSSNLPKAA